ncbi:MAG: WD40/YVTN/BNR-like repeat-containing protein [Solirubrobacteraceae bacterium]
MAKKKRKTQGHPAGAGATRAPAAPPKEPAGEGAGLSLRAVLAALALLAITGVGAYLIFGTQAEQGEGGASPAQDLRVPWLDPDGVTPIVGSVDVNPADESIWLSTNTGMFRVARGSDRPERVTGNLTTDQGSGEISPELVIRFRGPDELIASGHPPAGSALPPALGLIASDDAGRTWNGVSEVGRSDFHAIQTARGDVVVAGLFGEAAISVSRDGGRTFETRTPPEPLIDLEVDPGNPQRLIGSNAAGLIGSTDGGESWRQREPVPNVRFSWPASDALFRIEPGGPVKFSSDGGETWEDRGSTGGEPQALFARDAEQLHVVLLDGTIKASEDGGRSWTDRVVPPPA